MSIVISYITQNGLTLARRLKELYPKARIEKFSVDAVYKLWSEHKNFIFIMAAGIVVRTIAPLIKDKRTDPAVVVLDEKGRYAISLLSGHLGGANELARNIAQFLGGEAVITTSSDLNNLTSIDLWAKEKELVIENEDLLPKIATRLINNKALNVYLEYEIDLPEEFKRVSQVEHSDMIITNRILGKDLIDSRLILRPRNLVVGIGCNSGTSSTEIEDAIRNLLNEKGFSFLSINSIATIYIKSKEKGIIDFVTKYNLPLKFFNSEEINSLVALRPEYFNISEAAFSATGAYGVAEPVALLASGARELLIPKQKIGNVTVAVAEIKEQVKETVQTVRTVQTISGRLYIIGTGPGGIGYITPEAIEAIRVSEVIVGYKTYIELIKDLLKDKEVISTGMTQEIERAKKAVELALSGKAVSIISGGDPGIYGMAGLVLETLRSQESEVTPVRQCSVKVIPGISALNACAARLGAPLMHDFAVISLSDRLTEWSLIEKRLELAAMGDFVIVIYNPRSKGRPEHINKAREILLRYRLPETPVGIVRGAMRSKEEIIITNLKDMLNHEIDMETTVIIGNSRTYVWNNWMITPRGYEKKMQKE
ncbi:MAG: precorrin-3B C(17)-methyltransferase [Thermodesulfovibrionales bacterium]